MRLPCSRSYASGAFRLVESRWIHQKQISQQALPTRVRKKSRVL